MGGSVKVTVRQKDGTVTKMCRWTNNLGYWFHTPEFIAEPDTVLLKYVQAGEDSAYNSKDETLAPDGYGLIVIDAVNKLILSHQDYTSLNSYHGTKMILDLHIHDSFDKKAKDSIIPYINLKKLEAYQENQKKHFGQLPSFQDKSLEEELELMKKDYTLFMMGAIQLDEKIVAGIEKKEKNRWFKSFRYRRYLKIGKVLQKQNKTSKDWLAWIKYNQSLFNFNLFKIDLGGYQVINFNRNNEEVDGLEAFKDKLKELGFQLTEKDEADWDEYIKDS